jgi:hypothetical protein
VWQSISYYSVLAVQSVFGVFGVRLYEEPHYDVIDRIGVRSKSATTRPVSQPRLTWL